MEHILEILVTELLFLYIIKNYTYAKISKKFYIGAVFFLLLIVLAEYFVQFSILVPLSYLAIYFVLPKFFIKSISYKSILYDTVMTVGIVSFIDGCMAVCLYTTGLNNSVAEIISHLIGLVCITLIIAFLERNTALLIELMSVSKKVKIIILIFIWVLCIVMSALVPIFTLDLGLKITLTILFLVIIAVIVACLIIYMLLYDNVKSTYYQQLNKKLESNVREQVRHYNQINEANANIRKFKHDFDNLVIGMNTYLNSNDIEMAKVYLNRFSGHINTGETIIHTGNSIVDALIADKYEIALEYNINFEFDGIIPSDVIDPVDLCIIFGNALDNAIESCMKISLSQYKNIKIMTRQSGDMLFVSMTNPVLEKVKIKNGIVMTSKSDTSLHGIGIYSMRKAIDKYHGHLTLNCTDCEFITEFDFVLSNIKAAVTQ